ncbi:MAG TPA: metallophosphoesterase family protein [Polyangia bacterium]|nr:metallophosphoesterase family protein [Polyangia bacterium]
MRVALISDLHGNEAALDAVLADAARAGADRVVCLGDVATLGPRPREVLARLRALGCECILGNHDEFLFNAPLIHSYSEAQVIVDAVDWCRAQLSADELAFVRSFKSESSIALDGGATLLLFHGSPRSHMEDLLATTPPDELDRFLDGRAATVMAGGHTHVQMARQHRGMLLVNPGSVGLPFKEYVAGKTPTLMGHAEYALVESQNGAVGVNLRRVAVDGRAHRASLEHWDSPLRAMLMQQYV